MNGFLSLSRGKKIACVALTIAVVGGISTAIALQRPTSFTPNNTAATELSESLAASQAARQTAYELAHAARTIDLTLTADGWDATASNATVRITGTDCDGKAFTAKANITCNTTTPIASLTEGTYALSVITTPVLSDGSIYNLPANVTFTVNGSAVTLSLTLKKADLATISDIDFAALTTNLTSDQLSAVNAKRTGDIAAAKAATRGSSSGASMISSDSPSSSSDENSSTSSEDNSGYSPSDSNSTKTVTYYCSCRITFSTKEEVVSHINYYKNLWTNFKISDEEMYKHSNWGWYYG
jgi:hypothetical protein